MQRNKFVTRNQLKRSVYFYIVLFFFAFLAVFLLLANLDRIVAQYNQPSVRSQEQRTQAILERYASGPDAEAEEGVPGTEVPSAAETAGTVAVSLLGDAPICETLKKHLDMLQQPWRLVDGTERQISGLIIVAIEQLSEDQLDWLLRQNADGAHLMFATMPPLALLERSDVCVSLGIETLRSLQTYDGMRTSKEMMLGAILEYDGGENVEESMSIRAYDLRLSQQVKVFAHALTEDYLERNVEDLPPLFWRYAPSRGAGYVYVCNGSYLSDETAYALLPTVLGDINGDFLYPIVNAYCLMIDGFPYAVNEDRELWRKLYSRDGFGIQRELLLPEWQRIENMYGVALTCFSPALDEIRNGNDPEMQLYHSEFQQGESELAGKEMEHYYLFSTGDPLDIVPVTADFSFEMDGRLQIPYLTDSWQDPAKTLFRTAGMARGFGFIGLRVDVPSLLEMEEETGLPEYFEQVESNLGYQKTLYPWIERTTVREAVERIGIYLNLHPEYAYHESGVTVRLNDTVTQAWFLLKTHGKDLRIDHGSVQKVGESAYLVTITGQTAEITWRDE